jgi:hypothetical protein
MQNADRYQYDTTPAPVRASGDALQNQPGHGPIMSAAYAGDSLVNVARYLHRFDHSKPSLMVVRTFQKPTGERYRRVTYEPWQGL